MSMIFVDFFLHKASQEDQAPNKSRNRGQKDVELDYVLTSDTLPQPHAMMVVFFDANITKVAMDCSLSLQGEAFVTVILVHVLVIDFILPINFLRNNTRV